MIIAVDFDGTISISGKPNYPLIKMLKSYQQQGSIVILWTCREGPRLADAVRFCHSNALYPNYVNCNSPEGIRAMGHDSRKIYADVYIDDKSAQRVI